MYRLVLIVLLVTGTARAAGPNILFILADDLGWSDLGCYGNEIFETPHLDRLAASGTRFTQAYAAAPICSASRAGILTGRTPARLGFEFVTKNEPGYQPVDEALRAPPFTLNLALEEQTISEALTDAHRPTAFFGKWHLNQHYERYLGWSPTHGPKAQGFATAKENFGSHPYSYWKNKAERSFLELPEGEFPKDTLTEKAIEFLEAPHDRPYFCMVSHFYVHDPVHTRMRWLYDHYLAKIPDTHPRKEILAHYGAMITTLDHQVGLLLSALEKSGKADSTLVVFTSDNGGHPNYAGNAPLRGSKWNLYEGGLRVPFLTRFGTESSEGKICDTPVWSLDLFPTFAALAEADDSTAVDSQSLLGLIQNPQSSSSPRSLYWHFPYYHPEKGFAAAPTTIGSDDGVTSQTRPHSAIRRGDWKLLHFYEDDRVELYHLSNDPGESRELSREKPDLASSLRQELESYLAEAGARLPTPNPNYPPKQ